MKKFIKIALVFLLTLFITGCNNNEITYSILIDQNLPTEFVVGSEEVDFKEYFIIIDSKGTTITVTDEMIDRSSVDFNTVGDYTVTLNFKRNEKSLKIKIKEQHVISYTITIDDTLPLEFNAGTTDVDFRRYFIIEDSNGNLIEVTFDMIDVNNVNFDQAGTYIVKINYQGQEKELTITVKEEQLTYSIIVNDDNLATTIEVGSEILSFKEYFKIVDSKGNILTVTDGMIDTSEVDFTKEGSFNITITFNGISKQLTFTVISNEEEYKNTTELMISEYAEGTGYNKYIELFNGTGKSIDLSQYSLVQFNNGNTPASHTLNLSGILKDGQTFVIYNPNYQVDAIIKDNGDITHKVTDFNGNDVIALYKGEQLIDVVGDINNKVDKGWTVDGIENATLDHSLIRKSNVYRPNPNWTPSEWIVLDKNDFSDIKNHLLDNYTPTDDGEDSVVPPKPRVKDLLISEYFEGNGDYKDSKYIEIFNGLGKDVNLSDYSLAVYKNGSKTPDFVQELNGTLTKNEVYVVYAPYSVEKIKAKGHLASEVCFFNGKAAIALLKNGEVIDVVGVIGEYPNAGWPVNEYSTTMDNTLVRKSTVDMPTTQWDPNEWYVYGTNNTQDLAQHFQLNEDTVVDNFYYLFELLSEFELNNKGNSIQSKKVRIKGTIYMDVINETKLVYITDGYYFIKVHGDYIHNYTAVGQVYEIVGDLQVYQYMPNFAVSNLINDITRVDGDVVTDIYIKEVELSEIVKMKRENFLENLNNGYLQHMLKITGYLQYDDHNSTRPDYALTVTESYTKNDTQYIKDALYFKNDTTELEKDLFYFEVIKGEENIEIDIYGVLYDWNPNRKNWRLWVDKTLTVNNSINN